MLVPEDTPASETVEYPWVDSSTPRAVALNLLRDLCRAPDLEGFKIPPSVDWRLLWNIAFEQGLGCIVANRLLNKRSSLSPEFANTMRAFLLGNAHRSLALAIETLRLHAALMEGGVKVSVFKGGPLAVAAYGEVSMRQVGDIDFFVFKKDRTKALAILEAHGYHVNSSWRASELVGHLAYDCELELVHPERRIYIDLHWEFTAKNASLPLPVELLMGRLCEQKFCNRSILTFSPEDQILILCVHGAKHHWEKMEWLLTIGEFIRLNPQLDWNRLLLDADKMGIAHLVNSGLRLSYEFFRAPLPHRAACRARNDTIACEMGVRSMRWMFSERSGALSPFEVRCFNAFSRGSRLSGFRYWCGVIFTPSKKDYFVYLPRSLAALYYPLRAMRLARDVVYRLLKRSIRTKDAGLQKTTSNIVSSTASH